MSFVRQVELTAAKDVRIGTALEEGRLVLQGSSFLRLDRYGGMVPVRKNITACGYLAFSFPLEGKRKSERIRHARAMAIAVLGMPPASGMYVNHKNGIKTDDRPENLEWATPGENHAHAIETGLYNVEASPFWKSGERHPQARLRVEDVRQILARFEAGETHVALAAEYGVSDAAIDNIARGISWQKQLPRPRKLKGSKKVNHQVRGSAHHATRLTDEDVRAIHREHVPGDRRSVSRLQDKYGIGKTAVYYILQGKNWNHIYREFHP